MNTSWLSISELYGRNTWSCAWGCMEQNAGTPYFLDKFPLWFWIPLFIIVYFTNNWPTNSRYLFFLESCNATDLPPSVWLISLGQNISLVMWWLTVMWIPCHLLAECLLCVELTIKTCDYRIRWSYRKEVRVIFSSSLQHSQRTNKVGNFHLKTKTGSEKNSIS